LRLILLGDVMLGRLVNRALTYEPPEYPWGNVLPLLLTADALVLNLECVISDRGEPWPGKTFVFRSDLKNVAVLESARVTAVSLANNHVLDMGGDALGDCLNVLAERRIASAGAGLSLEAARRPALFQIGSVEAALIAFTDNEPGWEARGATPGVFYAPVDPRDGRFRVLLDSIREAASLADLVIVSAHWGGNWGEKPPDSHRQAAHLFIDAGAHVIHGHSAHVLRGVEIYRNRPIFYSCGDFVDDYAVDEIERNDQSCVFALELDDQRMSRLLLVPTVIRNLQAQLACGRDREAILARMRRLSDELGTTGLHDVDDGLELRLPDPSSVRSPA